KNIIDSFKTEVLSQRRQELLKVKTRLMQDIKILSEEYNQKASVLSKEGSLRSLKVSLHEQELKRQQYNKVSFLYEQHLQQESRKLSLNAERGLAIVEFKQDREDKSEIISKF